jgi:hypothetical protein
MQRMRTAIALAIVGVSAIVVGIAVGGPEVSIEGATFTRSTGTPKYAGVFTQTGTDLFSPQDGNLWIGAGLACCLAALVLIALSVKAHREAATR